LLSVFESEERKRNAEHKERIKQKRVERRGCEEIKKPREGGQQSRK
jgi:hypothetical protein